MNEMTGLKIYVWGGGKGNTIILPFDRHPCVNSAGSSEAGPKES